LDSQDIYYATFVVSVGCEFGGFLPFSIK